VVMVFFYSVVGETHHFYVEETLGVVRSSTQDLEEVSRTSKVSRSSGVVVEVTVVL
jgi:hypothetical protein